MKYFSKSLTIFITGLFAVTCFCGIATAADTIKLGVAGPHSGDLASYGIPTVKAAELVVKEVNAKGGVLGKQVELVVEDDVCKPEIATNTATKLVSEQVPIVLGHICSGATKAALGIYKASSVIAMTPIGHQPRSDPKRRLSELLSDHRLRRCSGPVGSGFCPGCAESQKNRRAS